MFPKIATVLAAAALAVTGSASVASAVPPKCAHAIAKSVVCGTAPGSEHSGRETVSDELPTKPSPNLPSYRGYDRDKDVFVWQ